MRASSSSSSIEHAEEERRKRARVVTDPATRRRGAAAVGSGLELTVAAAPRSLLLDRSALVRGAEIDTRMERLASQPVFEALPPGPSRSDERSRFTRRS